MNVPPLPPTDGLDEHTKHRLQMARQAAEDAVHYAEKHERVARESRRAARTKLQEYERLLLEFGGQLSLFHDVNTEV